VWQTWKVKYLRHVNSTGAGIKLKILTGNDRRSVEFTSDLGWNPRPMGAGDVSGVVVAAEFFINSVVADSHIWMQMTRECT
jgi:hypothetical protein